MSYGFLWANRKTFGNRKPYSDGKQRVGPVEMDQSAWGCAGTLVFVPDT